MQSIEEIAGAVAKAAQSPEAALAALAALDAAPSGPGAAIGLMLEQGLTSAAVEAVCTAAEEREVGGAATLVASAATFIICATRRRSWQTALPSYAAARALLGSPKAVAALLTTPRFDFPLADKGVDVRQHTLLGALLSVEMEEGVLSRQQHFRSIMELFPYDGGYDDEKRTAGEARIQSGVSTTAAAFQGVFEQLLRAGPAPRLETFRWAATAMRVCEPWRKTMKKDEEQLPRCGLAALFHTAVAMALPVTGQAAYFPTQLPTTYLFAPEEDALLRFPADEERIISGELAVPLDAADTAAPAAAYPPKVHFFFLALRGLVTFHTPVLEEQADMEMRLNHPSIPAPDKAVIAAIQAEMVALLSDPTKARNALAFANSVAQWLLHVLGVDEHGMLPTTEVDGEWGVVVPPHWANLPLCIVDSVFRLTVLVSGLENHRAPPLHDIGYYELQHIVSLMLVIMGNTQLFPKAHTHTMFPRFLSVLMEPRLPLNKGFINHRWFVSHAMRGCVECYIAVQPCEQERISARHYLSLAMMELLKDNALTNSIAIRYNDPADTTLEKLCSMLTAELTSAIDSVFDGLIKMRDLEVANDRQAPDTDEYRGLGHQLRSSLALSTTAVKLFNGLTDHYSQGMARHLVIQQISAALIKFIVQLAGPQAGQLKIATGPQYGFEPRKLLHLIVTCFVKFAKSDAFGRHCVESQTSLDTFYSACAQIVARRLVSSDLAGALHAMVARIKTVEELVREEEEVFDDPPEWALCALMYDLLHDPVALPMEGEELTLVNRESIRHNLLSSGENPFNRKQLTMEEVEEFTASEAVRPRIEDIMTRLTAWKEEQRAGRG